jgi:hypothetical protein
VKNSEEGYSGIFLGYRPLPAEGEKPRWQCQVVSINKRPLPDGAAKLQFEMRNNKTVDRELLTIVGTSGGTFTVQRRHIAGV